MEKLIIVRNIDDMADGDDLESLTDEDLMEDAWDDLEVPALHPKVPYIM